MQQNKPHLVLDWVFDIPNQILKCNIGDDLEYHALEGGYSGLTKRVKDSNGEWKETFVSKEDWNSEKSWISENYGELVGYFQFDPDRVINHPIQNRPDRCPNGVGPDGRYLDHLQRMQILLDGEDMSIVARSINKMTFVTPDCGKTIYKRIPTRNVLYPEVNEDPDAWWPDHPQPCLRQPYSRGVQISSYEEMQDEGISEEIIQQCIDGNWSAPLHPELQSFYVYPTA
jgi:hypothetical protein